MEHIQYDIQRIQREHIQSYTPRPRYAYQIFGVHHHDAEAISSVGYRQLDMSSDFLPTCCRFRPSRLPTAAAANSRHLIARRLLLVPYHRVKERVDEIMLQTGERTDSVICRRRHAPGGCMRDSQGDGDRIRGVERPGKRLI